MDLESIQKLYKTNIYYNSDVNGNTTTEIFQNGKKKKYTNSDPRVTATYIFVLIGIIIVVRNIK